MRLRAAPTHHSAKYNQSRGGWVPTHADIHQNPTHNLFDNCNCLPSHHAHVS